MERVSDFVKGTGEKIRVGQYEIRKLSDGTFFIEHESGDGTQFYAEVF